MKCRGIRGATVVLENSVSAIVLATKELLDEIIQANQLQIDDIASIFFTATPDLTATFPAAAARELGLQETPLICMTEIAVPGALAMCIRVMFHVNTSKSASEICHVYLRGAKVLRPDFASK